jgi:hypothetical protein
LGCAASINSVNRGYNDSLFYSLGAESSYGVGAHLPVRIIRANGGLVFWFTFPACFAEGVNLFSVNEIESGGSRKENWHRLA